MFISAAPDSPETRRLAAADTAERGHVMNLTRLWGWRSDVFEAFAKLRGQLTANSSLSEREQAVIVCATAARLGDSYCALAWGAKLAQVATPEIAAAVLRESGHDALTARERALAAWVLRLVEDPNATREADVQQLRDAGFDDREIFEATVFAALRLAFSTVNDALGVAPDWQLAEAAPGPVRAAVGFGRGPAPAP